MLLHALRRYCIPKNLSEHGLKTLCLLYLTMLSKRMFLLGQKLYNRRRWHGSYHFPALEPSHPVSLGQMAWAIYLVLCTITRLCYLLRPCSFYFLGHCTAWAVHLESSRPPPPQPYTLGAWHGPSFSFTTVSLVFSNPSFRPSSLQLYKMHHLPPPTHTVQDSGYFYSSYDTEPLFDSHVSLWFATFILPFWAYCC